MNDEGISVPVGDASHLLDNVPKMKAEVTRIRSPLEIGESDGSTTTAVEESTGRPVSIPADVVDVKDGQQQIEEAVAILEPCCDCGHFGWPKEGSEDWHEREAAIMGPKAKMPANMSHIWPYGGPPAEFGHCSEPELVAQTADGRVTLARMKGKALVHYHRAKCPNFRTRVK